MNRREILRYTAYFSGTTLCAPIITSILSGCAETPVRDLGDGVFTGKDMELLTKLADLILPRTDSPSASDVGVPQMINHMVTNVYTDDERIAYITNFKALKGIIGEGNSDPTSYLSNVVKWNSSEAEQAFEAIRQQTIAYYLSTEEIGKNYLNYLPVPGAYDPCVSLEELGGKAWAI